MNEDNRETPDVLAYPLVTAREVLQKQNFQVEVKILGEFKNPDWWDLRVARQIINPNNTVEIVAVYALCEVIDEV
ncbi:hypothetical protein [Candidatus Contubernalis alkaliaceticus]|uniref:hypothetical protein n=1 Tax=Candidatus Contubernalis alkaliaceticus TaxID=338645 RepID=UPI001F4C0F47|nr:hypothetical protein [Candidatus Contubernalis alkalaceticus]UNC91828.1 hypothetical protein HUE98_06795 [Candidatus Contubernalis alkalaceticus]